MPLYQVILINLQHFENLLLKIKLKFSISVNLDTVELNPRHK